MYALNCSKLNFGYYLIFKLIFQALKPFFKMQIQDLMDSAIPFPGSGRGSSSGHILPIIFTDTVLVIIVVVVVIVVIVVRVVAVVTAVVMGLAMGTV